MTYFCFNNKKEQCAKNTRGIAAFNLVVIIGFFVLAAAFLIQGNSLVEKNYQMLSLQKILSDRQVLLEKLEVKKIEGNSLGNLQDVAKNFNLVGIDKVTYLKNYQESMALVKDLNP